MSMTLQSLRGMKDLLPAQSEFWEALEDELRLWQRAYGYRNIRTPLLEQTQLFSRAIGEVTDIVEKEMFSFVDAKNGDHLTLRPEGTASAVRAAIEHGLTHQGTQRLYYIGPMFRHERPQAGRFRQFHQIGVEAFGPTGPDIDAEHLVMCARLWRELGINDLRLELNSLGSSEERQRHRSALVAHLEANAQALDEEARRRMFTNPLRVLDSKNPNLAEVIANAPKLSDYLENESQAHFSSVVDILDELQIPYRINPRLVRGLDYYNLTVFEWISDRLGAQGTVCAGGRYDGLFVQLGGPRYYGCGFAIGLERLISLLVPDRTETIPSKLDVYVIRQSEGTVLKHAFRVAETLRDAGLSVVLHVGGGNFRSQLKRADESQATFAVIVGEDEARDASATIKALRSDTKQITVPADACAQAILNQIYGGEAKSDGNL